MARDETEGDPADPSAHKTPSGAGKDDGPKRPAGFLRVALYIALLATVLVVMGRGLATTGAAPMPYSEFKAALAQGRVVDCVLRPDRIVGRLRPLIEKEEDAAEQGEPSEPKLEPFQTLRVEDEALVSELAAAGVEYSGASESAFLTGLFTWLLPIGLLILFWMFLLRRGAGGGLGGAAMTFGKSKAKLVADMDTGVDFGDVAGCDEAKLELAEVVDFLKHPERYQKLGAKIPKGVLLVGSPGTGKTLLARAVAGEAKVPFFSISGSDFVEMFVGVGAARVRDLFDQAKKKAPCIVFIDEIDAIGRTRGVHMSAVNDEREQTLNQLLVEMDGFEPNSGVILLSATNRPDVLDRALLRPGRFDRHVVLDIPDVDGRAAILRVHAKGKPIGKDVDLNEVARATPGMSGADLANAMNEAALLAARRGGAEITRADVEDAIERLVAGPERKSRRLSETEKRRVAYHESGHALVAWHSEHADPVHKISIVPRGRAALGFTMQLPLEDQYLLTRPQLDDKVTGMLGGRAAEELVFGDVSTGAANDLDQATQLVRQMICLYGMGDSVRLMSCAREVGEGYPTLPGGGMQRDCSEETAREIDEEVRRVLDAAYERAQAILRTHRDELELVAAELLARESLTIEAFEALLAKRVA